LSDSTVIAEFIWKAILIDAGSNFTVECRVPRKSFISWSFLPHSRGASLSPIIIFNGTGKVKNDRLEHYDIHSTEMNGTSTSVLTVPSVQLKHVGIYTCQDITDENIKLVEHGVGVLGKKYVNEL